MNQSRSKILSIRERKIKSRKKENQMELKIREEKMSSRIFIDYLEIG